MMIDSKFVLSVLLCTLVLVTGCSSTSTNSNNTQTNSYYSESPMSELEYKTYLTEKVSVVTNQLTTHMIKLQDVADGSCSVEDELEYIDDSKSILKETKENLTYSYPPDSYSDIRERFLNYIQDAIDKFDEISADLESGDVSSSDLVNYATQIKSINVSVQGLTV